MRAPTRRGLTLTVLLTVACLAPAPQARANSPSPARTVSFRNDVQPVLARAGCNLGVCHGNKNGKGGFKLTLRGQDPAQDYVTLTRDLFGRRVDLAEPERSLLLLKATGQVSHEGGLRFTPESDEYHTVVEWIRQGASDDPPDLPRVVGLDVEPLEAVVMDPETTIQIRAAARFSDGSRRDVTKEAVYEPSAKKVEISPEGLVERTSFGEVTVLVRFLDHQVPVRLAFIPDRGDYEWKGPEPANFIDERIFARMKQLRLRPVERVDDRTFLRRLYLDLLGFYPTAGEARAFLEDPRPDRRRHLVDALLERPEFAENWALKWSDLLRNEEKVLDRKGVQAFHGWLRDGFREDRPLDEMAREILAGTGSTYRNPPSNFYRANRTPVSRAEASAQIFLGLRLQCARCHNHPFDRWTQDDYYSWTALFARVETKILQNRRRDRNDKHEFRGEQIVYESTSGVVKDPRTSKPAPPAVLDGRREEVSGSRLEAVARWVGSAENPFFSRVQANRIWSQMMGRGLVNPIDDFRATNPASHPRLLEDLAQTLVEDGFRIKPLIRRIALSQTYQLATRADIESSDLVSAYACHSPRRLPAEALVDSLSRALRAPVRFNGYPEGTRALAISGVNAIRPRYRTPSPADKFLKIFGKPQRLLTCECERSDETTLAQAFQMISGPLIDELLSRDDNLIGQGLRAGKEPGEVVEELYREALHREPTAVELEASRRVIEAAGQAREGLEDVAWSVLNSREFLLRS